MCSLWMASFFLMKDVDYAPEGKWTERDKKRRKRRYGMVVSGQSVRLLDRILRRKSERARSKRKR